MSWGKPVIAALVFFLGWEISFFRGRLLERKKWVSAEEDGGEITCGLFRYTVSCSGLAKKKKRWWRKWLR